MKQELTGAMVLEFLYEYGLFLAKAATLVIAILLAVGGIAAIASRNRKHGGKGQLEINSVIREAGRH